MRLAGLGSEGLPLFSVVAWRSSDMAWPALALVGRATGWLLRLLRSLPSRKFPGPLCAREDGCFACRLCRSCR